MSASVFSLLAVALAASLAELLLPGDEGKGTKRFLKILVSLAVLLLLLRPFLGFLDSAQEFFKGDIGEITTTEADYNALFDEAIAARSKQELENRLYGFLQQQFSIEREDAHVAVSLHKDGSLHRVSVILSGKALLTDPALIEAALADLLHCEVEVR